MAVDKRKYKAIPVSHTLNPSPLLDLSPDPLKHLNEELLHYYRIISLCESEVESRQRVFNYYKRLFEEHLDCTVEAFGSYCTTTMVHGSDIDITVLIRARRSASGKSSSDGPLDLSREFANASLSRVDAVLTAARCARGPVMHIKKARTPIIKMTDKLTGYKIDLSVNKSDGVAAAQYIIQELATRPCLRYFVILIKCFLKRRGLSDASIGGLSAYAQFLMIQHFFQMHPLIQNGNIRVEDNLAVLFMDFFQLFGVDFPYDRSVISVKDSQYKPNNVETVCVEDPISKGNNVTGGCTCMHLVKDVFAYSYKIMAAALSQRIDPRRSLADLWLRMDSKELRSRAAVVKGHKK